MNDQSAENANVQDGALEAIPVFEEVSSKTYTGVVKSTHGTYCFLTTIRQAFASVATGGHDVFCPQPFPEGALVEFDELNPNTEKGQGHFRADNARLLADSLAMAVTSRNHLIVRAATIAQLTLRDKIRHKSAKQISPEQLFQAAANGPFVDLAAELLGGKDSSAPRRVIGLGKEHSPMTHDPTRRARI